MTKIKLTRRNLIAGAGAAAFAGFSPRSAFALPADVDYEMHQVTRGAVVEPGLVRVELPRHSDAGTSVPMTLSVDGPLSEVSYPEAVHVYGTNNPRPRIMTAYFSPLSGEASVATRIRLDGAQDVVALLKMNDGSFHKGSAPVSVTFGACASVGSGPEMPDDYVPTIRIAMPDKATSGEIVTVRTLISHPMESGLRLDANNSFVPLRIIERFTCRMNGIEALRIRLEPAIATNPFFEFKLLVKESAAIEFEWLDTNGQIYGQSRHIAVG
jgi:thiosulfate oxidation carrier complex protein SoxZ